MRCDREWADVNSACPSPAFSPAATTDRRLRLFGWLLLIAAGLAFFFPAPYQVLQAVGTKDNRTLDSAGYEERHGITPVDPPVVRSGDQMLDVILRAEPAAVQNKNAADKRSLALLFGLPGMFMLGRSRRSRSGD